MPAEPLDPNALPGRGRVIVAFSGGPDSVCLMHQLSLAAPGRELLCAHVDHGLDPESARRAERAAGIADNLGVSCRIMRVEVGSGRGPEAAARDARYRALEGLIQAGDVLVTGHHADDQAETVLLRLVRGAGPEGLAGIPPVRRFGSGWLARPLLDWQRHDIEGWLEHYGLDCIRDPANDCPDFDRNHLRQDVLPAMRERWPGVDAGLRRSARLCRGAAEFVAARVDADLDQEDLGAGSLELARLSDAGDYYRGAAIRAWCVRNRLEPPPGRQLDAFIEQLSSASSDRCPELRWGDHTLRYWAGRVWLETGETAPARWHLSWDGTQPRPLPAGLGTLRLVGPPGPPLELEVRSGRGGESLRPDGDAHHRACKRLLSTAGVPPWRRAAWPRIWHEDRLVALGTDWLTAEFQRLLNERGQYLVWETESHDRE